SACSRPPRRLLPLSSCEAQAGQGAGCKLKPAPRPPATILRELEGGEIEASSTVAVLLVPPRDELHVAVAGIAVVGNEPPLEGFLNLTNAFNQCSPAFEAQHSPDLIEVHAVVPRVTIVDVLYIEPW